MQTRFHIAFDRTTARWQVRREGQRLPLVTHPSRDEAIYDAEKFAEGEDAIIILHMATRSTTGLSSPKPPNRQRI